MTHRAEVVKYDLSTRASKKVTDCVAEEKPLHLFVNAAYWATILCSPSNLKKLAVGHLLSEGLLRSTDEIEEVNLKENESSCYVKLKTEINVEERLSLSRLHQRIVTSACGGSAPYQYSRKPTKVKSNLKVKAEDVGRHNAVDKVIGIAALNQTDFGECFLASSGRLSGDIVFKAAKVGLPIVASLATALDSASPWLSLRT